MAIEILELDSTHQYFESTFDLDGVIFRLEFRYNTRIDSWIVTLYDSDGLVLSAGRRLTVGNMLFPWLATSNHPAGQLMAVDSADEDEDPGLNDLGNRVKVFYADRDELVAAGVQFA